MSLLTTYLLEVRRAVWLVQPDSHSGLGLLNEWHKELMEVTVETRDQRCGNRGLVTWWWCLLNHAVGSIPSSKSCGMAFLYPLFVYYQNMILQSSHSFPISSSNNFYLWILLINSLSAQVRIGFCCLPPSALTGTSMFVSLLIANLPVLCSLWTCLSWQWNWKVIEQIISH